MKSLSIVVALSTTHVVLSKKQPGCDWSGQLRTSGVNSDDDFYLTCSSGFLTSVTKADEEVKANLLASGEGSVTCDWTGPRRISGANSCDDFNFECYDSVLYGMKTCETESTCSTIDYAPFGSASDGVVCNYATPIRLNGANDGDDFALSCQNGTMDNLYFDDRRRLDVSTLEQKLKTNLRTSIQESKKKNNKQNSDDAVTCTTWATSGGSWQLLHQHNEDFTYEYTYGTSSTDSDSTTSEWAESYTESLEEGMEFEGFSEKETISSTVSYSIAETVSSSLTVSYTETTTTPCSSPNGNNEGGALFQWVISSQHMDESSTTTTVFSDSTVCVAYQGTPQCPLDACADQLCQNCTDWESDDTPTGGFLIGSCDWSGEVRISGVNGDDDYYIDCPSNKKMDGMSAADGSFKSSETTTACSSCDWTGPRFFSGPNGCDDAMLECYNGFIYGITYVGDSTTLEASSCRNLVQPADPLTGVLCNWQTDTGYAMQDVNSNIHIEMVCDSGVVDTYTYLV